jgi:hypothetical protein
MRHRNGTLARCDADGWCARATVRKRPSGKKRGESASGSVQKRRTLRSVQRGTECDRKIPAQLELKRPDIGAQHVYSFG